eukprot:g70285.t1
MAHYAGPMEDSLRIAASINDKQTLQKLISWRVAVNGCDDAEGKSALMEASRAGHVECVKMLIHAKVPLLFTVFGVFCLSFSLRFRLAGPSGQKWAIGAVPHIAIRPHSMHSSASAGGLLNQSTRQKGDSPLAVACTLPSTNSLRVFLSCVRHYRLDFFNQADSEKSLLERASKVNQKILQQACEKHLLVACTETVFARLPNELLLIIVSYYLPGFEILRSSLRPSSSSSSSSFLSISEEPTKFVIDRDPYNNLIAEMGSPSQFFTTQTLVLHRVQGYSSTNAVQYRREYILYQTKKKGQAKFQQDYTAYSTVSLERNTR